MWSHILNPEFDFTENKDSARDKSKCAKHVAFTLGRTNVEGDIIIQPPMHPRWIYSTFGERKHVINRAVFPLLHLEIKWLPFQDSKTNMDIF